MEKNQFRVTFRGVRGSIPTPSTADQIQDKLLKALELVRPDDLKDAVTRQAFVQSLPVEVRGCFGGNSSCVEVSLDGEHLVFDCGSGFRELGLAWMKCEFSRGQGQAHIFLSHTHWDHILGVPFFVPFYVRGNRFTIYSPLEDIGYRLEQQQAKEYFPVPFSAFSSDVQFQVLQGITECKVGDARITWKPMYHPGKSFAYRVEYMGKTLVYATDAEYKRLGKEDLKPAVDFFRDADLLIFDSQYTFSEGLEKEDWGHSSTFIGVDLAVEANVKKIAFYHHEPTYSDFKLADIFRQTEKYLKLVGPKNSLQMVLAAEGESIDLI